MNSSAEDQQHLREESRQYRESRSKRKREEREHFLSAHYDDPVREYWRRKGQVAFVRLGLEGMTEAWARVADIVSDPERMRGVDFDEYCHLLGRRKSLDEALGAASKEQMQKYLPQIAEIDRRFLAVVDLSDRCIYGATIAEKWGYTREKDWWYFCHPRDPGRDWLHL
jgi:hypothetical protein